MTTKTLRQRKLSTLLALALRDVRKQEQAPNSKVDMNVYLKRNGTCEACAAGSVMRWTLGCRKKRAYADDFDYRTQELLYAIDFLRCGDVSYAGECFDLNISGMDRTVRDYAIDPEGWHADMQTLLADLRENGL